MLHCPRAWGLSPTSFGAATRHGAEGLGTAVPTPCCQDPGQGLSLPGSRMRKAPQQMGSGCSERLAALLLVGLGSSWVTGGFLACGLHAEVVGPQHQRVTPDNSPR